MTHAPQWPENITDMIDDFAFLTDWEDRYMHDSGRSPDEIIAIDANAILKELDLSEHLSPQRSNGLQAMIGRIKAEAKAA